MRGRRRFIAALFVSLAVAGGSASADICPGNPDALGTSRVLTISPSEFGRVGSMQYKQTLPLNDHEVVITFDDGPLPPYTNIILDTLASQCVKATYFLVGRMAHAYPSIVRHIYNEGHTIGTHSQDHPLAFQRLPLKQVAYEVDGGIASVVAAIGDAKAVAPFFRIPGLGRSKTAEGFLASQSLVTWSADVDADDWFRHISAQTIVQRALRRLEAKGPRHPTAARHPPRHRDGIAETAQGAQGARLPCGSGGAGGRSAEICARTDGLTRS